MKFFYSEVNEAQLPQENVNAPPLEMFRASLNWALINLI